jgi:DNA-directed RNA polymerase subunit E'
MRQAGLGTALWLEEEMNKEKEKDLKSTGAPKEVPREKGKSKRKENASGE